MLGLFALLAVNSIYLVSVSVAGWWSGKSFENLTYLYMFLLHLVLGTLIVTPVIIFGVAHMRAARGPYVGNKFSVCVANSLVCFNEMV